MFIYNRNYFLSTCTPFLCDTKNLVNMSLSFGCHIIFSVSTTYFFCESHNFGGYTETFKTGFLKHFMKWLLLETKILLLKSSIRKDFAVSVNKASMNKSSSKNVFLKLKVFTLLHLLVAAHRGVFRTWSNIYHGAFLRNYLMVF